MRFQSLPLTSLISNDQLFLECSTEFTAERISAKACRMRIVEQVPLLRFALHVLRFRGE